MRAYPIAVVPGIICSLIAFILLLIVTISTPMWNSVFFLKMLTGPQEPEPLPSLTIVTFGVFGTTNSAQQLGYSPANWSGTGVSDPTVDVHGLRGITYALILHPIAAIFGAITFGFAMIGLCTRAGAVFATITAGLLTLLTIVAFVVDMVLFATLKSQLIEPPYNDRKTWYGPALWITLAALIASAISLISTAVTAFTHNQYPRKWGREQKYIPPMPIRPL
ncbi:hypothetical protein CPB86DRAFT_724129 [Serendipita vermifera]|nr:hypothetical protein CPB86DRAFT_724129 [Serendipita vermifera]